MMVLKRKQIVVLALVMMIIIAGYLQYSYRKEDVSTSKNDESNYGEAMYVNNSSMAIEEKDFSIDDAGDIGASIETSEFFAQAKLDREITRSMDTDSFKEIINNPNVSEEVKAEAFNNMMSLIEGNDLEMRIENLVRERGFSDVIALFADDGSIDIIVKSSSLTDAKVAQIADIVTRQANLDMSRVHIKNKY